MTEEEKQKRDKDRIYDMSGDISGIVLHPKLTTREEIKSIEIDKKLKIGKYGG